MVPNCYSMNTLACTEFFRVTYAIFFYRTRVNTSQYKSIQVNTVYPGNWWISTVRDQYAAQVDGLVHGGRHAHTGDMYDSRTQ